MQKSSSTKTDSGIISVQTTHWTFLVLERKSRGLRHYLSLNRCLQSTISICWLRQWQPIPGLWHSMHGQMGLWMATPETATSTATRQLPGPNSIQLALVNIMICIRLRDCLLIRSIGSGSKYSNFCCLLHFLYQLMFGLRYTTASA